MKRVFPLFLLFFLSACSSAYLKHLDNYSFKSKDGKPDYGDLNYWAAHPWKKDLSDSISKPLKKDFFSDSLVDVFFLYPTSYLDKKMQLGQNAPIDDSKINARTDYSSILYQASVFNNAGRVFAPRYRQANYYCYFPKTKEDTVNAINAFELAYSDIKSAFEYYLKNYNNGRPIIITAHSQGTTHAKLLLREFFDGKLLQNKLVAAYLVGMPVEPDYFKSIRPCLDKNSTGCFCSWRTFEENYIADYVAKENFKAVVTNPLTWDTATNETSRKDNPGSILKNFNKVKPGVTNAVIKDGVLWAKHPRFFGSFLIRMKNYHIADYNFYYLSIRQNVANRINLFWKK